MTLHRKVVIWRGRGCRPPLSPPTPPDCASFCAPDPAGISLQVDSLTDHSCSAESDGEKLPCRAGDPLCESGSECKDKYEDIEEEEEDEDDDEEDIEEDDGGGGERDPPAKPATSSPLAAVEAPLLGHPHADAARSASKAALGGRASPGPPTPASKPKLWSLAEIATSADRAREAGGETAAPGPAVLGGGGPPRPSPPRPRSPSAQCPFPNGAVLPRPLYYTAPFYPGYTNYGSFGALHGHPAGGPAAPGAAFNGLNQTVLSRAEGLGKEPKAARSQPQAELGKDSPYELKKGMSSI